MLRTCTKCHTEKPVTDFYKYRYVKSGLTTRCKECLRGKSRKDHFKFKDRIAVRAKKYYLKNKEKFLEYKKQHYLENLEKYKRLGKIYRESHVEQVNVLKREWAEKNRDRVNLANRNYKRRNRGKNTADTMKRYTSKLRLTPTWSDLKEIEKIYIKAQKMADETGIEYHVDHIYPLQGELSHGLHVPWNLQILEASENLKKSNKMPSEDGAIYMRGLR